MALVTIRNPEMASNRVVVAGESLAVGTIVKLVQAATVGDPCKVTKATGGQFDDATLVKGIVTYIPDNDLSVDFILNPTNEALTVNTEDDKTTTIPSGALCLFWYNKPVVGVRESAVHGFDFDTAREGGKVSLEETNSLLTPYTGAGTSDHYIGTVYQHEGAELTILLDKI